MGPSFPLKSTTEAESIKPGNAKGWGPPSHSPGTRPSGSSGPWVWTVREGQSCCEPGRVFWPGLCLEAPGKETRPRGVLCGHLSPEGLESFTPRVGPARASPSPPSPAASRPGGLEQICTFLVPRNPESALPQPQFPLLGSSKGWVRGPPLLQKPEPPSLRGASGGH